MAVKFGLAIGAHDLAPLGVRAQELLLSRTCRRATRSASTSCRSSQTAAIDIVLEDGATQGDRHHPRAPRRGRGQVAARGLRRACPASTSIAPARRCWRSSRSPTCARRRRPSRTCRRSTRSCATSRSATATCRKARSAATPTCRCAGTAQTKLGTRTEIKNLNSFRFVEKAIKYEVERQIELLEGGGKVVQETRLYDPDATRRAPMRSKEEANDYRYFPDPDLLPVVIDDAFVDAVRATLPELPDAKRERFGAQVRPVRLRRRRAHGEPRARRLLRGSRGSDARASRSSRRTG